MALKVAKFGGSSLADADMIRRVAAIVGADPQRQYVVPSAPGKRHGHDQKITDLLYLCHEHARQEVPFDEVFAIIAGRFGQIIDDLGLDLDLRPHLEEVRGRIAQGAGPDYTASRGEALNGRILAAVLQMPYVDAAEVIRFAATGRFDREATDAALARCFSDHTQAVIPGFYGSMPDGTIKTFSRGGSDVTGAIVARAAGAAVYENWTDVSGLLVTDPNVVHNPRPIQTVTYRELRELAYMGASVLHDEAIFPVREAGIPVNIRNTNDPDHPGTMIVRGDQAEITSDITGIAGRRDFTVIAIEKALMNAELGYGRRLLETLEASGISFEHMPSGIDTISVVIRDSELDGKLEKVLEDIRVACKPDSLEVFSNMALIATVGRGMAHHTGTAARLFAALADAGVNIRMIDQGSSELNIIVGVEADDFEKAVQAIYRAFVT
ncbi:MAG: aspartate kinase [Phycisphaerae bacterium]|nr:aspartate kinase [Phycisphaerae bacterium]